MVAYGIYNLLQLYYVICTLHMFTNMYKNDIRI